MKDGAPEAYPGAEASAAEIFALATEFHAAAEGLMPRGRRRQPISLAPARFCAIHAIELYFIAYLLAFGDPAETVRAYCHNLADRADKAAARGLVLRSRTIDHLRRMTDGREYLVSRYGPEQSRSLSETNRLMATLAEVSEKVWPAILNI